MKIEIGANQYDVVVDANGIRSGKDLEVKNAEIPFNKELDKDGREF